MLLKLIEQGYEIGLEELIRLIGLVGRGVGPLAARRSR
jgi:hypothetical protein